MRAFDSLTDSYQSRHTALSGDQPERRQRTRSAREAEGGPSGKGRMGPKTRRGPVCYNKPMELSINSITAYSPYTLHLARRATVERYLLAAG
jgi:hypothetical protein